MSALLDNLTKYAEARRERLASSRVGPNGEGIPNATLLTEALNANGELLTALKRLRALEVNGADERAAWDTYVAGAFARWNSTDASAMADNALAERRKRFGGSE